jgi:regulation of enolase protein 1 (concanavalin A-like superfamily)
MKKSIYTLLLMLFAFGLSAQSITADGAVSQTQLDGSKPAKPEMVENRSATCSGFIYEQDISLSNFNASGRFIGETGGSSYLGYDDFTITTASTINKVILTVADFDPNCSSPEFIINFRADGGNGSYGQVLHTRVVPADAATYTKECIVSPWNGEAFFIYNLHIPIAPLTLAPGTYWLQPYSPNQPTFTSGVFWQLTNTVNGSSARFEENGFNILNNNVDFTFALSGSTDMPASYCAPAIEAVCQNTTVTLGQGGQASITASDVDGGSSGFTNSSVSPSAFDCSNLGANTVTLTVDDGNGNSDQCTATITVQDGGALVGPWSANDVGSAPAGNTYNFEACGAVSNQFTISGSGNNGFNPFADATAFASQSMCGNFYITAKLESVDPNGYGGLMVRESAAPGAKQFSLFSNLSNILLTQIRQTTNGAKMQQLHNRPFPVWLRIVRNGTALQSFYSTNGMTFVPLNVAYINMASCVDVGMAAFTSYGAPATAVFSNVSLIYGIPLIDAGGVPSTEYHMELTSDAELFPNPAQNQFTLRFQQELAGEATATLRNQIGQAMEQRQLKPGDVTTEWDVSSLPSGLYFMEVRQEGLSPQVLRVVKQ